MVYMSDGCSGFSRQGVFVHVCYFSAHPIAGAGGTVFVDCPSLCPSVHIHVHALMEAFLAGLLLTYSLSQIFILHL